MFTADVVVQDHDEIAQDSSSMLAHGQGTCGRVVDFGIITTAPAVGLSRVPPNTTKTTLRLIWYHDACCLLHEPEKTKRNATTRTRTCSYSSKLLLLYLDVALEKTNQTICNHIFKLQ